MKLLVVGSVALDSIITPFGEVSDALGGSAVYFSVAASVLRIGVRRSSPALFTSTSTASNLAKAACTAARSNTGCS